MHLTMQLFNDFQQNISSYTTRFIVLLFEFCDLEVSIDGDTYEIRW